MAVAAMGAEVRSGFGYPSQGQDANWQKQLEGLERQESELQQSQSRLMKEPTTTVSRDLSGLRQEMLSLKLASSAVKADAAAALDARALELRELLGQERREREAAQAAWKEQVAHMERSLLQRRHEDLAPLGRQVNDLETQLQKMMAALEGKLRQECQHLETGFQEKQGQLQKDVLKELSAEQQERNDALSMLQQQTRQLEDRLSQQEILHSEVKRELELSQDKLQRELRAQCGELQSLVAQHTEEAGLASQDESSQREQQFSGLGGRIEEVEQELRGRASARVTTLELELGKLTGLLEGESVARQEQCKSLWRKTEDALSAQMSTVRSQLDKIEDSQVSSSANMEKVLDATSESLTRRMESSEECRNKNFHELGASLQDLSKQKTVLLQRIDSLESNQKSSLERHAKELEDLAGRVEEARAARQAQSETTQRLQDSLAQAERRHSEEMSACREQAAAQLRESELRQAAALADISNEAAKIVGTKSTEAMHVLERHQHMLQEQFEQLRKSVRESGVEQAEIVGETNSSVKAMQGWLETSEEDIKHLKTTQEKVVSDLTSCKIGLDSCHSELGKALDKALARLGDLEADESAFRSELESLRSRHSTLDAAERAAEESLQVVLAKLSVCEASERSMNEQIKSQGEQLRSLGGMASLEAHVQRLAEQLGACEAEVEALSRQGTEDHRSVKEQCDLIKQHLQIIKDQQTKAQTNASSSLDAIKKRLDEENTLMRSLQSAQDALKAEHVSLDSRCSDLSTSIQGVSMSHKSLEDGAKAAGARQTQAVADQGRRLDELHSSIKVVEDRHSALLGKLHAQGQQLGTLEHNLTEQAQHQDAMWSEAAGSAQKAHEALEACLKEDIAAVKAHWMAESAEQATRIERLAREQDEFDERHSTSLERMASLEKAQFDEAKLRNEAISELRSAQAGQIQQLEALDRTNQLRIERFESRTSGDKEDFQHLQRLLDAERSSRETELEGLREQITCEEETREQSVAALQERCRTAERSLEQMKQENARTREEHGRLTDRHTSVSEKLAFMETKGSLIDDAHEKLDELKRRISRCEQHGDWIGDMQRAQASLESDRTSLESEHQALRGRVLELDRRLQEAAEANEKTVELLRSDAARLSSQAKLQDSNQASLGERLDHIESSLTPAVEDHTRELSETALKFDRLHGRLAACEKLGQGFGEDLRQVQEDLSSRAAVLAAQQETQDRLGSLEQGHERASEEQRRELERVSNSMEQLETRVVSCERLAGPTLTDVQAIQAKWPAEKASLESHLNSLRDRIDELEPSLSEVSSGQAKTLDLVRADLEQLRGRVSAAEQQQASGHSELRRLLDAELAGAQAALRERLGDTLQQLPMLTDRLDENCHQLNALRGRQEDNCRVVETLQAAHAQLAGDLSEAAGRSGQLAALLAQEQESRVTKETEIQKNLTQLEVQMSTEFGKQNGTLSMVRSLAEETRPELQKLGDEVHERLGEIRGQIDPLERQLQAQRESIEGDRRERQLKEVAAEERLECERGARELQRRELAGLVARERQVTERLTIVERSVTAVDELARREIEARARESRRIWDALDNHTHDLSTQVVENFAGGDDDKSYETFPCQPLTKLLRLGNARGADFPLLKGEGSAETQTPPSRRASDRGT